MQIDFVIELFKVLKKNKIHTCLDTSGILFSNEAHVLKKYNELLKYTDLVLLDIKHITKEGYIDITCRDYLDRFMEFVKQLNESGKDVWIRQVVVPGIHDNSEYMTNLVKFLKDNIKNIKRVDFLPYHKLGGEKYGTLGIPNPYADMPEMDIDRNNELYKKFLEDFEK